MQFETLERKLAACGAKVGRLKRTLYRKIAEQLPENLEILAAGEGLTQHNGSYAPVIVGAETVYIAHAAGRGGGAELFAVPRDSIVAVELSGRFLRKLEIVTGEERFVVGALTPRSAAGIAAELERAHS